MYSRYGDNGRRPVRLPEHYGGSAFSQQPTEPFNVPKREPARPLPRTVGEKASPVADRLLREESAEREITELPSAPDAPEHFAERAEEKEEKKPTPPTEKPSIPSPLNFGALRRLLEGKGGESGEDQDRLLLLGLILLLSRTEGDSDILLWLSLLLLCG